MFSKNQILPLPSCPHWFYSNFPNNLFTGPGIDFGSRHVPMCHPISYSWIYGPGLRRRRAPRGLRTQDIARLFANFGVEPMRNKNNRTQPPARSSTLFPRSGTVAAPSVVGRSAVGPKFEVACFVRGRQVSLASCQKVVVKGLLRNRHVSTSSAAFVHFQKVPIIFVFRSREVWRSSSCHGSVEKIPPPHPRTFNRPVNGHLPARPFLGAGRPSLIGDFPLSASPG